MAITIPNLRKDVILQLQVQACGSLAHVFLAVAFFTSLYFFAFFKQQTFLHVLLPTEEDQARILKHYVIGKNLIDIQQIK